VTPAERALIDAAKRYVPQLPSIQAEHALKDALGALDRESAAREAEGRERTWGDVITNDEIYSAKTGRWYKVVSTNRQGDRVAIMAKGLPKIIKPLAADPVRIRRGDMGRAADVLISVLTSGPRSVIEVKESRSEDEE